MEPRIWEVFEFCRRCQATNPYGYWKERDSEIILCISCGLKFIPEGDPKGVRFDNEDLDVISKILKRLKVTPRRAMTRVMI
jgi:Zn ribbon nucleic-acid-binding protein